MSGNHFSGKRGAYIEGFMALRWVMHELGYTQPRKLKGEERVLSHEQIAEIVAGQPSKGG